MRLLLKIVAGILFALVILLAGIVIHANFSISREEVKTTAEGAPGRMFELAGHQWHVQTIGNPRQDASGAPVLLIHGFAVAGAETFQPWASTELRHRSLILPDLLGYGHSQRITSPGPHYALRSYSNALAKLLDQLGVAKVDVIGHSYGGSVAAQFALDHPDRVRRIVFISAAMYVEPSRGEHIIQLPFGIGRAVAWHAFGSGPWSINAGVCKRLGCRWLELARIKDTTDTLRAMMRSHRDYEPREPLVKRLPQLRAPALILWGEKDLIPLAHGQRLSRDIKAPLMIMKGAAHLPHLQAPEEVGRRVRTFLQPELKP